MPSANKARAIVLDVPTVLPAQARFWASAVRNRRFSGGIGSGKTFSGAVEILRMPAGSIGTVVAPTWPQLRDSTLRVFLEVVPRRLIREHRKSERTVVLVNGTQVMFRSADNPDGLRGPNLSWCWLDEGALMDPTVWPIMLGRLRLAPGRAWVTTTPRGTQNWCYRDFVERGGPDFASFHAQTAENVYNLAGFAERLERIYTGNWKRRELGGEDVDVDGSGPIDADRLLVVAAVPAGLRSARGWDTAATEGGGDFTAGVRVDGPDSDGVYYVSDVARGQWEMARRNRTIRQTAELDGREVRVAAEQGGGDGGKVAAALIVQLLAGFAVRTYVATGSKLDRAAAFISQVNAGNVRVRRATWTQEYVAELRQFLAGGEHDDQVDAGALAFRELTSRPTFAVVIR